MSTNDLEIEWTDDCQGKKDYDGCLLRVSTRYWPGHPNYSRNRKPSAHCTILAGVDTVWATYEVEADTEQQVKAAVEAWVATQWIGIKKRLGIPT